jgi:tagatose-1,6-bisphosphate aldolase non-catalytic subunit AgaZ/GatZ
MKLTHAPASCFYLMRRYHLHDVIRGTTVPLPGGTHASFESVQRANESVALVVLEVVLP